MKALRTAIAFTSGEGGANGLNKSSSAPPWRLAVKRGKGKGAMPRVIEYLCKQCGRKRLESNHWWEITDVRPAYLPPMLPQTLVLRPFTGASDAEYFCGRACASREVEAWMASQSAAVTPKYGAGVE